MEISFESIGFTLADMGKAISAAFTVGFFFSSFRALKKDHEQHKVDTAKKLDVASARSEIELAKLRAEIDVKINAMNSRQTDLEERHIVAVEKLGDAMRELGKEVQTVLGDHTTRLAVLENKH
jgi:hypothetical protein